MKTEALDPQAVQKLEEQFDSEVRFRPLLPATAWLVAGLLFTLSIFHYYTAGFGLLREATHRGIHMAFVLGLIFLVFPLLKRDHQTPPQSGIMAPGGIALYDWLLAAGAVVASLYMPWIYDDLAFRVGNPEPLDVAMATIAILVLLEATRRSVGWPLPIIAVSLMVYAMYGQSLPGILAHPGNSWSAVVNHLYLTSNGIYGIALGVVATYVFHYVLFGVLATRVGLGRLFIDLATALAGRYSGGPAKVSIFGSAMFGMISGSSIANTVTVGSLTIPAMMRLGYPRHMAAAIESTASTGGQITPPIMGAAAFLMIEFLNLPYQSIVLAAIVPAFMHFFGVFWQVHFEAKKNGLKGIPAADLPKAREVIARDWPAAIPLFVLLMVLFSGFTPYLAAFWGITACVLVGFTRRNPVVAVTFLAVMIAAATAGLLSEGWATVAIVAAVGVVSTVFALRDADGKFLTADMIDAFVVGAKYAIAVGAAAATVGIIVGVVTLTGVGFKISNIVTSFAAQLAAITGSVLPVWMFNATALTLFFTLVMTAVVCILLGCGVPTTANYIIMVTVAAPSLALLGVEPIVAHFFVFYYGVLADITPPVALAAYAAASMAGADPFKTGNTAFRLGLAKALVPFVFVYGPAMLIVTKGFTWTDFVVTTLTCALGVFILAAALTGFAIVRTPLWQRLSLGVSGLLLMAPNLTASLVGIALALPAGIAQIAAGRAQKAVPEAG
ncbi:MAG: TRAP transporter permease [Phreatobacter sp.]|uniref:TRAP transporter permease n=1 Tax=Phreatobacter sp. TaxID=1966341 RepID=UPI00273264B4|nr:TRAP transporter permease [Phreatobacter sp.]MDP2803545.1 TRAP transporter permease [Phreatobacter sp.]